jgi:hypothetical protein
MDEGTQAVKAMALIRRSRDGALLVSEYTGPGAAPFHQLLGAQVEFREYAIETVHRELQDVELAGVIENHFTWKNRPPARDRLRLPRDVRKSCCLRDR